jgi:hypothetical protein
MCLEDNIMKPISSKLTILGVTVTAFFTSNFALAGSVVVNPHQPLFIPQNEIVFPPSGQDQINTGLSNTGAATNKVSAATTTSVVKEINSGTQFCRKLVQKEYVIDCLSERLENAAKALPSSGDYAEAKIALEEASRKLHALALKNASRELPRVRMQIKGAKPIVTSRRLIAVKTDKLEQANKQAIAIVQEAETVLLRATESSTKRKVHYERIAKAVGSNKVLLRSS